MKKKFYILVVLVFTTILNAQVGVNTSDPKSTLDVNGNLKIRTVTALSSLNTNHTILVRDQTSSTGDFEIKEVASAYFMPGNSSAYYATKTGSGSLVDLGLGSSWSRVNLTGSSDTKLGSQALFTSGVYTAPQTGVYAVTYEYQFNAGVNLEALGGKKLGLIKNGNIIWDEKLFDGVRVSLLGITLASVPVTSTTLTSLVQLNTNDTLTFAVNVSGLLPIDLTLLNSGKVNIYIYKISN
ncbi:hypothetical protein [Epilithonimonas tenax]|uniref:hypothetical protein n=1 Tax=Epilithonimonas tenax TaxID=191577 RepID=UPI000483EBBD|nr:hypothetical protein [Epilithonimonas tenax]